MCRTVRGRIVDAMTSTEPLPSAAPVRRLRRSTTDRVGAGVAGGLGEYFRVDPILFRVGFAVGAFFGGAGVLAYLVAWAVIPADGSAPAPVDRWVAGLRARRFPAWLVALVAAVLFWAVAFSWWWPHPVWPLLPAGIIALAVLAVRDVPWRGRAASDEDEPAPPSPSSSDEAPTVSLDKPVVTDRTAWVNERRQALQERRRRAWPLRAGAFAAVIVALTVCGITDAVTGIRFAVYFWVVGAICLAALVLGILLRRTPLSVLPLLIVAAAGTFALGGSTASLSDGVGDRTWTPTAAAGVRSEYRLAMGDMELDLRSVPLSEPTDIHVRGGFGNIRVVLPRGMDATVQADVHLGQVTVDGERSGDDDRRWGSGHGGINVQRTIPPLAGATGPAVTIHVDLAAGQVQVDRVE